MEDTISIPKSAQAVLDKHVEESLVDLSTVAAKGSGFTSAAKSAALPEEFLRLPPEGKRCPVSGLSRSQMKRLITPGRHNGFVPVSSTLYRAPYAKQGIRLVNRKLLLTRVEWEEKKARKRWAVHDGDKVPEQQTEKASTEWPPSYIQFVRRPGDTLVETIAGTSGIGFPGKARSRRTGPESSSALTESSCSPESKSASLPSRWFQPAESSPFIPKVFSPPRRFFGRKKLTVEQKKEKKRRDNRNQYGRRQTSKRLEILAPIGTFEGGLSIATGIVSPEEMVTLRTGTLKQTRKLVVRIAREMLFAGYRLADRPLPLKKTRFSVKEPTRKLSSSKAGAVPFAVHYSGPKIPAACQHFGWDPAKDTACRLILEGQCPLRVLQWLKSTDSDFWSYEHAAEMLNWRMKSRYSDLPYRYCDKDVEAVDWEDRFMGQFLRARRMYRAAVETGEVALMDDGGHWALSNMRTSMP
ncbi:hypothetical protein ACXR0O_25015 [Verrucomicrobiota bacterium sgz303538]